MDWGGLYLSDVRSHLPLLQGKNGEVSRPTKLKSWYCTWCSKAGVANTSIGRSQNLSWSIAFYIEL